MSFNRLNYHFSIGEHNDNKVILVHFGYDFRLKEELKAKFPSARWSVTKQCWVLPDVNAIRREVGMVLKRSRGRRLWGRFIR
ncbi:MAG: hypothetical protein LBC84_00505 [Prevotellaceae bacterium]|nr:hypothetical protein [Prevotellaceae bacterium]